MIDIAKARALVEPLLGASYALPSDARGWFDHPTAGHVPHNVCTDAADTIDALLDEVEHWKSEAASWEKQASDRVDDALKFAAERDALIAKVERLETHIEDAGRNVLKLVQERDALARDAARYRWLRQPNPLHREAHIAVLTHNGGWVASEEKADAAIDAAMKGASDES